MQLSASMKNCESHFELYAVVFRERLQDIQIIAIAHAKRRPGYWAKRI